MITERPTFHQLHDDVGTLVVGVARSEDRDDVRMRRQRAHGSTLAIKSPSSCFVGGDDEDLDRYITTVVFIARCVDRTEPALSERSTDVETGHTAVHKPLQFHSP